MNVRISSVHEAGKEGRKEGRKEARSRGMVGGRVAEVCCNIVAGVRWKQMFPGVVDPWEVDGEADLRTSAVDWGVLEAWRAVEEETSYADLVTGSDT